MTMGFMIPTAEYFAAYHVETNCGTEIVPEEVCGSFVDVEDEGKQGNSRNTAKAPASNRSSGNRDGTRAFPRQGTSIARRGTDPTRRPRRRSKPSKRKYDVDDDGDTPEDDADEMVRP
jgi:hypothetical protein